MIDANPSQKVCFSTDYVLLQYMKDSEVEKRENYSMKDFEPLKGKELEYHLYKGPAMEGFSVAHGIR